jgi:hypothetical protein
VTAEENVFAVKDGCLARKDARPEKKNRKLFHANINRLFVFVIF